MPIRVLTYWIKFRDSNRPMQIQFESALQMMDELLKLQSQYGWIEWMNRD